MSSVGTPDQHHIPVLLIDSRGVPDDHKWGLAVFVPWQANKPKQEDNWLGHGWDPTRVRVPTPVL